MTCLTRNIVYVREGRDDDKKTSLRTRTGGPLGLGNRVMQCNARPGRGRLNHVPGFMENRCTGNWSGVIDNIRACPEGAWHLEPVRNTLLTQAVPEHLKVS